MYSVLCGVLPIFLITIIGSFIRRKWLTSEEFWQGLEKLSFFILFPAMLFSNVYHLDLAATDSFRLLIALVVSNIIVSLLVLYYQSKQHYDRPQFTSLFQGATRYNNYIFFALSDALFGETGLAIVSVISPYMIILTNVTSVMCFVHYVPKDSKRASLRRWVFLMAKSVLVNPLVLASVMGLIFNYWQIELNMGVEKTINSFSASALTIGILIVGASFKFTVQPENINLIAVASFIKLIVTPIVTFLILWIMAVGGVAKSVGILFSCLPCASSAYILSRQLGGDTDTMSSIITFTAIFSVFSLSVLVYILG